MLGLAASMASNLIAASGVVLATAVGFKGPGRFRYSRSIAQRVTGSLSVRVAKSWPVSARRPAHGRLGLTTCMTG